MTGNACPRHHGQLAVGDGQLMYWEEWGSAQGVPALYIHGGPGGTLGASSYRNRFDLKRTRVVGFEQRGCGRSAPHVSDPSVSLAHNDTAHLIRDIESLREYLDIDAWIVNGASWGSTLALAYAIEHPDRVLGMILCAVTTTSRAEVDWVSEGVGTIFPEAWDRLAAHAEGAGIGYLRGHGRLVEAYSQLLNSPSSSVRDAASSEWALWEDTHVSISAGGVRPDPRWSDHHFRYAFARLTTHYWSHDGFCNPPILQCLDRLQGIPATLIHGRRDISGPVITPWRLHQGWPESTLLIEESDGHGGVSMMDQWREANGRLVTNDLGSDSISRTTF